MAISIPPQAGPIAEVIRQNESFLLLPHINVDGDCLGSMLALNMLLQRLGKQTYMYTSDELPDNYRFIKGADTIHFQPPKQKYAVIILVEAPKLDRIPSGVDIYRDSQFIINLDHHQANGIDTTYSWVDTKVSALGEIVFLLAKELKIAIDQSLAEALYTAIATDSGRFSFSNVSKQTMLICAELVDAIDDLGAVTKHIFRSRKPQELQLSGLVASTLTTTAQGKIAYADLTRAMLNTTGTTEADTQELVAELNRLAGVEVFALFKSIDKNRVRVSLRSEGAPVNSLAERLNVKGGGHTQAAAVQITFDQLRDVKADSFLAAAHQVVLAELERILAEYHQQA